MFCIRRATVIINARLLSVRSLSSVSAMNRAIYFQSNGHPASALSAISYPALPPPAASAVNLKVLLSPINPSDINVVQGVYPVQPPPIVFTVPGSKDELTGHVPGNEGLGQVEEVGSDVESLSKGDWVIFAKKQAGTWSSGLSVLEQEVVKVPKLPGLTDVNAATLSVRFWLLFFRLVEFTRHLFDRLIPLRLITC